MSDVVSSSITGNLADTTTHANALADALAWFDITASDQEERRRLSGIAEEMAGEIIEAFYDHILSFDQASKHFQDEEHINRVKRAQVRYFEELVSADIDDAYIENRRLIGRIHEQAGVTPTLYIGAYAFYMHRLGHVILDKLAEKPEEAFRLMLALLKISHFDMSLALETYVETREETIQNRERELSELPTPVLKLREGLLLIPVVGTLDSHRARSLTVELLEGIREHRAQVVVLDITGVAGVDSAVANHLIQSMSAARLMGAASVLTGISAEVAQALVKIGVSGQQLNTAGDLQQGIKIAEKLIGT